MIIVEVWENFKKIAWFLPGFLLYAAFPPVCETVCVLFALAPLLWLSRQGRVRASVWRWAQSGLFFWVATLSWMPAIVKNGGPWPLVVLGWFALAAYCTLYFAAFGYLSAAYWRFVAERESAVSQALGRIVGLLLVEPILWCGLELVRARLGGGFAWNQLGVVPANMGFGAPAALGGVFCLSAVVILINGSIAGVVERIVARGRASRWRSLETLLAFGAVFGLYAISPKPMPAEEGEWLKVALVQRNFPCCFKAQDESPVAVYSNLLSSVSALSPDLVVLPESAMGEFGPLDQQGAFRFARWSFRQTGGAALLAGGARYGDGQCFNAAALYQLETSEGGAKIAYDCYDKVHLVPFGEYIPGDKTVTALQKLAPVGSCTPGEPKLMAVGGVPFGTAICFEDTDSALVREFAARGARFLCFITNDSWFSHSNETLAHAWQATARAIETGLPVVRVGNSGVTGTIAPDGRCSWLTGRDGRPLVDRGGVMMDRIDVSARPSTPYVRLGDSPLGILFALLIGGMILVKYTNYYIRGRILK